MPTKSPSQVGLVWNVCHLIPPPPVSIIKEEAGKSRNVDVLVGLLRWPGVPNFFLFLILMPPGPNPAAVANPNAQPVGSAK